MNVKFCALTAFCLLLLVAVIVTPPTTSEETPPDWTEDIRLTEAEGNYSSEARIVTDSQNNLHVVYNDNRNGPPEIYYMKIDDRGDIVVDETLLTTSDGRHSRLGDCARDSSDNIHIVWDDVRDSGPVPNMEIYYMKLDNDGDTIVDETRITNFPHNSLYPSITVDSSDNVHIVWCEEVNVYNVLQEEIYYTKLDNNGNTLVNDMALTESDGEESLFPDIEADSNGNLHVVWLDDRNETGTTQCQDVYYTKLDNNGNTIEDDKKIFVRAHFHRPNLIISSDGMVHLTCASLVGWKGNVYEQIYYVKMDNDGEPIGDEIRLTNDEGNASHPAFHFDSGEDIHLVWEDERHQNTEIYYMKLDDVGNILHDELRLTTNLSKSLEPQIEIDGNDTIKVVWDDGRDYTDGNRVEIYFKYSPKSSINVPPTVGIDLPFEGQTVSDEITIQGWADDSDGAIQEVKVKIDELGWIDAQGTTSWTLEWDTRDVNNGLHTIYAMSFDGTDHSEEYITNITVNNVPPNNPPTVTIKPPDDDEVSDSINIQGTAYDSDGAVKRVQVKIDNRGWVTASGTTSWSYPWDTTHEENGLHVIYARAEDDEGEKSQSKSITLTVDNSINSPPQLDIVSPTGGTVSGALIITGTATDPEGDDTIEHIQVKIGEGGWENAGGTTEWSYTWNTTNFDDGEYEISVRAFDGAVYSTIKSVIVEVDNPHAPSLTVTSEVPDKVSGTLKIQGTASDIDGKITRIDIKIDDGEWQELEAADYWSYDLDTTKLSNGEHTITIRVIDDEDESYIEMLTINVENPEVIHWWVLFLGILLLAVIVTIISLWIKRRKHKESGTIESISPSPSPQLQNLECLKCGNFFMADMSGPMIQCPNCGASGTP